MIGAKPCAPAANIASRFGSSGCRLRAADHRQLDRKVAVAFARRFQVAVVNEQQLRSAVQQQFAKLVGLVGGIEGTAVLPEATMPDVSRGPARRVGGKNRTTRAAGDVSAGDPCADGVRLAAQIVVGVALELRMRVAGSRRVLHLQRDRVAASVPPFRRSGHRTCVRQSTSLELLLILRVQALGPTICSFGEQHVLLPVPFSGGLHAPSAHPRAQRGIPCSGSCHKPRLRAHPLGSASATATLTS